MYAQSSAVVSLPVLAREGTGGEDDDDNLLSTFFRKLGFLEGEPLAGDWGGVGPGMEGSFCMLYVVCMGAFAREEEPRKGRN
jgi:hypothetical protein